MKAIIPVAGVGRRLRPHTHTQPKALMHVAGRPILGHILDELVAAGIDEVVLVVGHLGEKVEEYVRSRYAIPAHFVEQAEPLGNGHAIYVAREHLDGDGVLIIMGDTIIKADLSRVLALEESAIGIQEVADPRRFGVVEVSDGLVRRLVEKPEVPPSNLAVVGLYLIRQPRLLREALERMVAERRQVRGEYWLADALQMMVESGVPMRTFRTSGWYDCGTPEALLEANRELLAAEAPAVPTAPGAVVLPPSYVDPTAEVEGSVIGPYTSIAEGARVRHSVIRDSIINAEAIVEGVLLEHSIIGEHASVTGRAARINLGDSSEVVVG
ncbi:MAG: sugar phosphate nucleotidyltransferase [Armatimonadota bacterium]|nr:sugar phosphate nucleotidyltransferase [Armatimonadota bacterium]MDR7519573.1 sugar phosphate nucleotidyltransferase [Armatimonadota bacterium]MDR7550144.1 sugar phosphate nucleotidyltransferase [Armatimonadota bacterium]